MRANSRQVALLQRIMSSFGPPGSLESRFESFREFTSELIGQGHGLPFFVSSLHQFSRAPSKDATAVGYAEAIGMCEGDTSATHNRKLEGRIAFGRVSSPGLPH